MAKLSTCILCGVLLRDGRNFDDLSEHVCEEVPPTEPNPPTQCDALQAELEARGEYLSELQEEVKDLRNP